MAITHQIFTDTVGNPVAAQIPRAEFQVIKAEFERDLPLVGETRAMLDRRSRELEDGSVEVSIVKRYSVACANGLGEDKMLDGPE
jgi:hypothetical protein